MNEELNKAKNEMKEQSRPYQTYSYYISIPVIFVVYYILNYLGLGMTYVGTLLLIYTIIAHANASKLTLVSNKKYVAPILIYVVNVLGVLILVPMLFRISNGILEDDFLALVGLISSPFLIVAFIFFFITYFMLFKIFFNKC